jgi:hypothetical protein
VGSDCVDEKEKKLRPSFTPGKGKKKEQVKHMWSKARLHFPIGKIGNSYFTYYFFKKKLDTPYFWK